MRSSRKNIRALITGRRQKYKTLMKKFLALIFFLASVTFAQASEKIPVKVLILPKFEVGQIKGDFPGEAQYYYEAFLDGGEEYEIPGGFEDNKLYVKNGVALYVTGMGKVNSALSTMAVLNDERFDFSNAYVISTGCAGGARDYAVMGDVVLATAAVDYDLGHHADIRDMKDKTATTWFHDKDSDSVAEIKLNTGLIEKIYSLVKNIKLETTEFTKKTMSDEFDGAEWAVRDPKVLLGTTVTGDNFGKGIHFHNNALLITKTYGCRDPYALTEMEDVAVSFAVKRMNMLDRYIIVRDVVNMDVFILNSTPENLWGDMNVNDGLASENSIESLDIFQTARKNNFAVGSIIIKAILNGEL